MFPCFKNVSFWKQTFATFAVSIGMFNWGNLTGWTNAANLQLRSNSTGFAMDDEGSSWVGSVMAFGGIFGSIFGGKFMDIVGRKKSLLVSLVISLIGWVVIAGASAVWIIIVGRFIAGWGASAISLISTVYVGELVSSEWRGAFGSALGFSMSLGLQYVILVGEIAPDWRMTTVACIIPVVFGIFALIFIPESPYYLAWKKGTVEAARPSLNWILHNNAALVEKSMEDIKSYLDTMVDTKDTEMQDNPSERIPGQLTKQQEAEKTAEQVPEKKFLNISYFDLKMIVIASSAMVFSIICGVPAMDYYMVEIFESSSMKFNSSWAAIIVRMAEIISTGLSIYLTDRMGRKALLLLSGFGMAAAMSLLGASFLLTDENGEPPYSFMAYLPLMGMTLFFFSLGFNWVVTLTLLGEIFSPSIKGMATSIATVIWWITDFITAKLYFISNYYLGTSGTFFLFASCCIAGMVFVKFFIRETKNKTLAQIQALYKAKSN